MQFGYKDNCNLTLVLALIMHAQYLRVGLPTAAGYKMIGYDIILLQVEL